MFLCSAIVGLAAMSLEEINPGEIELLAPVAVDPFRAIVVRVMFIAFIVIPSAKVDGHLL
jgi:hypothetical protein